MEPNIQKSYLFLGTIQEIWRLLAHIYSHFGNHSKVYEIRKRVRETLKDNKLLAEYYSELTGLWMELDHYRTFSAKCIKDAHAYQRIVEEDRLIDFLAGLDVYYDPIKVELIERVPLPDVSIAHARIQGEETRRHTMISHPKPPNYSALVATLVNVAGPSVVSSFVDRSPPLFNHCQKIGHTCD